MTATILLVRHGSHEEVGRVLSGRSGIGLNEAGRAEAAALAERLNRERVTAIYSSPRRRTVETAELLAAAHALPVTIAPALDEVDFGAWTGRSFAELDGDPEWQAWNSRRGTAATPRGETMAQAIDRAEAFLGSLTGEGTLLCVTHCDIIRGLLARVAGWNLDRLLELDCAPASATRLPLPLRAAA